MVAILKAHRENRRGVLASPPQENTDGNDDDDNGDGCHGNEDDYAHTCSARNTPRRNTKGNPTVVLALPWAAPLTKHAFRVATPCATKDPLRRCYPCRRLPSATECVDPYGGVVPSVYASGAHEGTASARNKGSLTEVLSLP